jgi:predicted phage terminase large subunit-like protein
LLVEPLGGKEARANAIEPLWEAGNVFVPGPDNDIDSEANGESWVPAFIEELVHFGASIHDDQVDAMSQALLYLSGRSARLQTFEASMQNIGTTTGWW